MNFPVPYKPQVSPIAIGRSPVIIRAQRTQELGSWVSVFSYVSYYSGEYMITRSLDPKGY